MVSCVFPGSFDPVTVGHLNLISRAAALFDRVTVTVMHNVHKAGTISPEERTEMLRKITAGFPNVTVEKWDGLLADYMHMKGERILVRGVRNSAEFEQEALSAAANRMLNPEFETLFLCAEPSLAGVSSSAVREISAFGGDIGSFVPGMLKKEITDLLSKNNK